MTMNNPSPDTPIQAPSTAWYRRFVRWWNAHLLHPPRPNKRKRIVAYAKASLHYHGRMHYTEGAARSELFHRPRGRFDGAHADCSQYSASLCHWCRVPGVTDTDWTGTLGAKGKLVTEPKPGVFVFFGVSPYEHMAVMVNGTHAIGFGSGTAPDESSLAGLLTYFASKGHPGHAFRDLTA